MQVRGTMKDTKWFVYETEVAYTLALTHGDTGITQTIWSKDNVGECRYIGGDRAPERMLLSWGFEEISDEEAEKYRTSEWFDEEDERGEVICHEM